MSQAPDDDLRTTPIGMARYSLEYLESAIVVDTAIGKRPGYEIISPIPALYLIGHSVELSLKAYLLSKGIKLGELRSKKYGHNLHACLRKAKELGLLNIVAFEGTEEGAIELLDVLYSAKELEYIKTGMKNWPLFPLLVTFSMKLYDAVSKEIGFSEKVSL